MNSKPIFFLLIVALVLVASGCVDNAQNPESSTNKQNPNIDGVSLYDGSSLKITRLHDGEVNATCWLVLSGGVTVSPAFSCLPDKELR